MLSTPSDGTKPETADRFYCRCGCGQEVGPSRKFISQDHYNEYRARKPEEAQSDFTLTPGWQHGRMSLEQALRYKE